MEQQTTTTAQISDGTKRPRTGEGDLYDNGKENAHDPMAITCEAAKAPEPEEIDSDEDIDPDDLCLMQGEEFATQLREQMEKSGHGAVANKTLLAADSGVLYGIGEKKDALGADLLSETLEKITKGKWVQFDYLEKGSKEKPTVVKINTSADVCVKLRDASEKETGVRFLTSEEFAKDPKTASYSIGVHIMHLKSVPNGLDLSDANDRNLLGTHVLDFLVRDGAIHNRAKQLLEQNLVQQDSFTQQYIDTLAPDKLTAELLNVELSCTAGRRKLLGAANLTTIVYKLYSSGTPIDVPFIPPCVRIFDTYHTIEVTPTEGANKGIKMFGKVPDMSKGEIKTKKGAMKGYRILKTKEQKVGLAYLPFCPWHGHAMHKADEVCSKWMEIISRRKMDRCVEIEQRTARAAAKQEKYTAGQSSLNNPWTRF